MKYQQSLDEFDALPPFQPVASEQEKKAREVAAELAKKKSEMNSVFEKMKTPEHMLGKWPEKMPVGEAITFTGNGIYEMFGWQAEL